MDRVISGFRGHRKQIDRCSSRRGWVLTLLLLLLITLHVRASQAQQYAFSSYGIGEGLSNLNVHVLLEDSRDVLWAGTENGVFRADGGRFHRVAQFDVDDPGTILGMQEDRAGRLWVLGNKRLVYEERGVVHAPASLEADLLGVEDAKLLIPPAGEPDRLYVLRDGELSLVRSLDHGQSWERRPPPPPPPPGVFTRIAGPASRTAEADIAGWRAGHGPRTRPRWQWPGYKLLGRVWRRFVPH